jgi:hypothetical protein
MLEFALQYAGRGWPVFPWNPHEKKPHTATGFYAATTDPAVLCRWWRKWPGALVALATGEASGIDVLDVDTHSGDGFATLADLPAIPRTLTASTPRAGRHHFLRHTPRMRCCRLGPGLEIKATGGLVILPPARGRQWLDQTAIAEPPAWISELAQDNGCASTRPDRPSTTEARRKLAAFKRSAPKGSHEANYALCAANNAIEEIMATGAADYQNDLIFDKAFGLGRMVVRGWITADAVEVALFHAGKACGLVAETSEAQVRTTILSGMWRGHLMPHHDLKCRDCPSVGRSRKGRTLTG